jgi:hypothetical protein
MKKDIKPTCQSCLHWHNRQAELDYAKHTGICTCFKWKFSVTNTADVMLLDRNNLSTKHMKVQRFENITNITPIEPDKSRYVFVTEEEFGCIHYKNFLTNK